MNISNNYNVSFSVNTAPVDNTGETQAAQKSQGTDKTLTVSITTGADGSNGVEPTVITLSYPLIGPEDIPLNEVMQQLNNLDLSQLQGTNLASAVLLLNQDVGQIAGAIVKGGPEFIQANADSLTKFFAGVEQQSQQASTQLFDLINNSTYPDFNSFLAKMLEAAQQLRQSSSEAKQNLIQAEYGNVMDQAKFMEDAAQKNYESSMEQIKAEKAKAWANIIGGVISAGGGAIGSDATMMVTRGLGEGSSGIGALVAAKHEKNAAEYKLAADLDQAIIKKLEGSQKLIGNNEQIADELRDIAKQLADMVLKLAQDFMSSQNQILQRSNI